MPESTHLVICGPPPIKYCASETIYIGGGSIHDDFIEPAAFRRKVKDGKLETGLSVNWVEWFSRPTPQEVVQPLCDVFITKGRKIGATSRFALLNVGAAKAVAAKYASVAIVLDEEPDDKSRSLITHYAEALNDKVAEQLQKAIIDSYPTKPA